MKQINTQQTVKIPKELTCSVKCRVITIKGPRGILKRSFKHLALEMYVSID
jgi:large subunit ribosomal protein L9e